MATYKIETTETGHTVIRNGRRDASFVGDYETTREAARNYIAEESQDDYDRDRARGRWGE